MAKIGVIGCGAWGLTLAKLLCQNDHEVLVWCHDEKVKKEMDQNSEDKENPEPEIDTH